MLQKELLRTKLGHGPLLPSGTIYLERKAFICFGDWTQSFLCDFNSPRKLYFHPVVLHVHLTYPNIQTKTWESRSL